MDNQSKAVGCNLNKDWCLFAEKKHHNHELIKGFFHSVLCIHMNFKDKTKGYGTSYFLRYLCVIK
jgi:predicted PolB exonuclease-like 3'-5' exonuclease